MTSKFRHAVSHRLARWPETLKDQQSGVALLAVVPFMITGLLFAAVHPERLDGIEELSQHYTAWAATILLTLAMATVVAARSFLSVITTISSGMLLLLAVQGQPLIDAYQLRPLLELVTQEGQPTVGSTLFLSAASQSEVYTVYALASVACFFAMSTNATLSRGLFATIIGLLLIDLFIYSFFSGKNVLGVFFQNYHPSQFSVIICLIVLLALRMVVKYFKENAQTRRAAREIGPGMLADVRMTALRLWWPMPVIFLTFYLLYGYLNDTYVRKPVIETLDALDAQTADPEALVLRAPSRSIEQAAGRAVDRLTLSLIEDINGQIDERSDAFQGNADDIMRATRGVLPARFPGTDPRRCRLLDFGCHIQNGVKNMINSGYRSARNHMLKDLAASLSATGSGVENNAEAAKARVQIYVRAMGEETHRRIEDTATGMRYAGFASLLYSFVILFKSYIMVFARVFYARVPFQPLAAEEDAGAGASKTGITRSRGSILRLKPTKTERRFYAVFRACGNNVVDRRRIPQPTKLALKRLFSGNFAMCLIDFDAGDGIEACDLIVDPPAEVLEWHLRDGDEVFVDMSTVIGFSESCRLARRISLSLGALIFGRAIYQSVQGPGRLFLRTAAKPLAGSPQDTNSVMQASSLIGWRRDTQFHIVSSLTISDIFLSSFSVRNADERSHTVVFDTSQTRRVGMRGGIIGMVRAFLLPF